MEQKVFAHSIEDLINLFPSDSIYVEVDTQEVKDLVNNILENIKTYNNIHSIVYEYLQKNVFDETDYYMRSKHTPEEQAIHMYYDIWRHGYWEYKKDEYEKYKVPLPDENFICVNDWVTIFENYIIETRGNIRTYEEAVNIAADKWIERIFNHCVQDPDQLSCVKGSMGLASVIATKLKADTIANIDTQQIEDFRNEIVKYYLDESVKTEYKYWKDFLSTDYSPDENLSIVFKRAGISKDVMDNIAPWKTIIGIDIKDNSVRLNHTYF